MEKGPTIAILVLSVLLAFGLGGLFGYNINENKSELSRMIGTSPSETVEVPLPDGRTIKVPSNHMVRIRMQTGGRQIGEGKYVNKTQGDALGGYKINPGATDITNIDTPTLDLTEGQEVGSGGAIASIQKGAKNGTTVIIIAGIAFLAAGILVILLLKMMKIGIAVSGIGIVLIGTGLLVQAYPWILLVGLFVIVAGIAGFVWYCWRNGHLKIAAEKVFGAIQKTDSATQKKVKDKIKEETKDPKEKKIVKKTVSGIKNKLGI